jgi:3-hydroxybutyryl-CoA dehydrogenase
LVVGGGAMGAGIAFVAARAGYSVELIDPDGASRERAIARIRSDAARAGDESVAARVALGDRIPERSEALIAIEAVPERLDLKRSVFAALDAALDPVALLASNTSSLSISSLAQVCTNPQRVIGLHFFNPPSAMKLVEIVEAEQTSPEALERARAFVERIGKIGVTCADTPGFIVNRVARPYYLQAMRALAQQVGAIEELDALARSVGFRMGPFELMDLIGLDVNLAVSESVYEALEVERFAPQPMQRELVAGGRLGRKTGSGFYAYEDGRYARLDLAVDPGADDEKLEEFVAVIGFGEPAEALARAFEIRTERVQRVENDEFLDQLDPEATLVVDVGTGFDDRAEIVIELDRRLEPSTMIFVDAYATDLAALAPRLRYPQRVLGYGVLGTIDEQQAVEVVDADATGDDALTLAQELFAAIGKPAVLVGDQPGLFLGRVVGSIVNEAMIAVAEDVASPDDIDNAMQYGVNYPRGPIAWGEQIGGKRIARILKRLAAAEGEEFAPHRSLWVLDSPQNAGAEPIEEARPDAMNFLL